MALHLYAISIIGLLLFTIRLLYAVVRNQRVIFKQLKTTDSKSTNSNTHETESDLIRRVVAEYNKANDMGK